MSPVQNPRPSRILVYSGLSLFFLVSFFTLSHTILKRSLKDEERLFDDASLLDSNDTEMSEVIGRASKEESNTFHHWLAEEERRKNRIEKHPMFQLMLNMEKSKNERLFSVPNDKRISLDEAVAKYEKNVNSLRCVPKQREENILYALKQQSTIGDNRTARPWLLNYKAYLDWRAWSSLRGRDREFCKRKYVKFMKMLIFNNREMTILSRIADSVARNKNNRFQVKLYRSVICLPEKYKRIAESLGLRRTHQTSFVRITPYTVGQIVKIKELVKVKLIEKSQVPPPGYLKSPAGFRIVGNMLKGMPI